MSQSNTDTTSPKFPTIINPPKVSSITATNAPTPTYPSTTPLTRTQNDAMVNNRIRYLPTSEAYDLWSSTYDTDGNFLQALDSFEMQTLLPFAIKQLQLQSSVSSGDEDTRGAEGDDRDGNQGAGKGKKVKVVDLGCGTGRNTLAVLKAARDIKGFELDELVAVDLSPKMLGIAERRCQESLSSLAVDEKSSTGMSTLSTPLTQTSSPSPSTGHLKAAHKPQPQLHSQLKPRPTTSLISPTPPKPSPSLIFQVYDMLSAPTPPPSTLSASLLISTLVLEHIPTLDAFFQTCSSILQPGGVLLLTNMHATMARISQAGFIDPETGGKIRAESYGHEVRDVIEEAGRAGFEIIGYARGDESGIGNGRVKEVTVTEGMVKSGILGERGRKWVGVTVWLGGVWRKKA